MGIPSDLKGNAASMDDVVDQGFCVSRPTGAVVVTDRDLLKHSPTRTVNSTLSAHL